MAFWSRIANVFRSDRVSREIDEELEAHVADAIEAGRDPEEARRAFGSALRKREDSRDLRIAPWLDALRADAVFGLRQIRKNGVTSLAAVLSLALAIGASMAAFRLVDALLWRPLPVAEPERLFAIVTRGPGNDGTIRTGESFEYPLFRLMQDAVREDADLIAVSFSVPVDATYGGDHEMEKASRQFVSGSMFPLLGIRPAAGRLLTADDDRTPGAHPYAVLSYDYWARRFGRDPSAIGRRVRIDGIAYEVTGVAARGFRGTETGIAVDLWVPAMMHPGVTRSDWGWLRTLARLQDGATPERLQEKLQPGFQSHQEDRARGFNEPKFFIDRFLSNRIVVEPASAGRSMLQTRYRESLAALSFLAALVLLIACANVANLMSARAAARAREMALRVAIGAGRGRLIQLVLIESAWIAAAAVAAGALFAWQAAPLVVNVIDSPAYPVALALPADWRVLGFGAALTVGVTLLFGAAPALRASSVRPSGALKGGDDPHARRRMMHGLIAAQVAFCFLVTFVAGLFVVTFERLSKQPMGFSAERLLTLNMAADPGRPSDWDQLADRLRAAPGVESVAMAGWQLMLGDRWNGFVSTDGGPPTKVETFFLNVSPGWLGTMKIPLLDGREFRRGEAHPGPAIVNEAFAKAHFGGQNPVGRWFERREGNRTLRFPIVGLAGSTHYSDPRVPMPPIAFFPLSRVDRSGAAQPLRAGTILVRTAAPDPLTLTATLRQEVQAAGLGFRVRDVRTQAGVNEAQTVRERLLAMLATFFAGVALLLAGIGLYGVLVYSVLQRRREIGIRLAIGAPAGDIARRVTRQVFAMATLGAAVGLGGGLASARFLEALLYEARATDLASMAVPAASIVAVAIVAAVPAVVRALRVDPVAMLRAE